MPSFSPVIVSEVENILDTGLTETQVQAFITTSESLIKEVFSSSTIDDDLIHQITIWVSAHYIASTRTQQLRSAEAGGAKAEFQGSTGRLFQSTFYGQVALTLDHTGTLSELDRTNRRPLVFCAISTEETVGLTTN